jgi:tetratricopeptide (TPR) repeat protein
MTVTSATAPPIEIKLPLAVDHIDRAVTLAIATFEAANATPVVSATRSSEATELLLRARQAARVGAAETREAVALVERAHALAPDDPKIRAMLAILLARMAFYNADADGGLLERAAINVRAALATAGDLADAHLAAGHLELHTGDPTIAAAHYRTAIARAPYLAETHEHLGRVLVEAGYIEAAFARFAEATAISPRYNSVVWEIARALALEGRWDELDRTIASVGPHRETLLEKAFDMRSPSRRRARERGLGASPGLVERVLHRDAIDDVAGIVIGLPSTSS